MAGALVASSVSLPMLASSASAAPSSITVSRDYSCTYTSFALPYTVTSTVTADGADVTATLGDLGAVNFPAGLKIAGLKVEVDLNLDGETVELAGDNTYTSHVSGGGTGTTVPLPAPDLTGERTGTADLVAGSVSDLDVTMKAGFQFSPAVPVTIADTPLTCTSVPSSVTVTQVFTCAFGTFGLPYTVTSEVTADGTDVTATLGDMAGANFPTALSVAGFEAELGLDLNGEAVEVSGENTYPTPIAGGGPGSAVALPMPELDGTRTSSATLTAGKITSLGLVMKAGFGGPIADNPLVCTPHIGVTTAPKTSGAARVGSKVTVATGAYDPADAAVSIQWLRNGAAIAKATGTSYAPVVADFGKTLSVRVTATKAAHVTATRTIAVGKVAAGAFKVTGKSKITGKAKVGKTLKVKAGKAAGAKVKYQWLSNGKAIKKATKAKLKLTKALRNKKVSVKVTFTKTGYTTVTHKTAKVKVKK